MTTMNKFAQTDAKRLKWDCAVFRATSEIGEMTQSDAQGIAEPKRALLDQLYLAGTTPDDAANALLEASTVR